MSVLECFTSVGKHGYFLKLHIDIFVNRKINTERIKEQDFDHYLQ